MGKLLFPAQLQSDRATNVWFVCVRSDAFYGQNTKIRETLNNLILNVRRFPHWNQRSHFVVYGNSHACLRVRARSRPRTGRRVLPCRLLGSRAPPSSGTSKRCLPQTRFDVAKSDRVLLCVRRLRFDVRLLQRVPYEGVSRMRAYSEH